MNNNRWRGTTTSRRGRQAGRCGQVLHAPEEGCTSSSPRAVMYLYAATPESCIMRDGDQGRGGPLT